MSGGEVPFVVADDMLATPAGLSAWADAEARNRLVFAAALFELTRLERHRLDPRRLGDRFVHRACLRWIARSKAAAGRGER